MGTEPGSERLANVSRDAFNARMSRLIVSISIVSLLATLFISVKERANDDTLSSEANTFSVSALGHAAFLEVLERLELDVLTSRHRSFDKASSYRPLLLLEPKFPHDSALGIEILRRSRESGMTLLVAMPKWKVTDTDRHGRWARGIEREAPSEIDDALSHLRDVLATDPVAPLDLSLARAAISGSASPLGPARGKLATSGYAVSIDDIQLFRPSEDLVPLLGFEGADGPLSLLGKVRGTNVFLLSDPDVLNTMGLGRADHALLAVDIITRLLGVEAVVVDETTHGFQRVDTIWEQLLSFPLVLLTFHLALLLALVLWAANGRFGRPRPRPPRLPSGKQVLIDNTATLLTLGHHGGAGLKHYLESTLRELSRAFGVKVDGQVGPRELERLVRLSAKRNPSIDLEALSKEVASLGERSDRRELRRILALARQIHALKTELLHGHRRD